MMNHLSANTIEQYLQQRLPAEQLSQIADHLELCPDCQARLTQNRLESDDVSLMLSIEAELDDAVCEEFCLTGEQILDHLEGSPLPAKLNYHLEVCGDCQLAVQEMRTVQLSILPEPFPDSVSPDSPRFSQWLSGINAKWLFAWNWKSASAWAMAIIIAGFVFWFWQTRQVNSPDSQQAIVAPSPVSSPQATNNLAVTLNDAGGQVTLNEQGVLLGLDQLPEDETGEVKIALQNQHVELPSVLAEMNGSSKTLMSGEGNENDFRVFSPFKAIIRTDRPEFRWNSLADASSYTVIVYDAQFTVLTTSPQLTANSWKPEKPLPRGRVLFWQVRAVKNGEEIVTPSLADSPAKFKVLDKITNDRLQRLEQASENAHLALGVHYARAGLKEEAANQFRLLLKANPDSIVAQKLLTSVTKTQR